MKDLLLLCPTLRYEWQTAEKTSDKTYKIEWIPQHLHNTPDKLHTYLQEAINKNQDYGRIIICVSSCGGSTIGLHSDKTKLIIPRTRDCLDILLSDKTLSTLNRPANGVFYTKGWIDFWKQSDHYLPKLEESMGKEKAHAYLRKLYNGFNKFYIIDTGLGQVDEIKDALASFIAVLNGTCQVIPGHYGILRKIAQGHFDDDFIITKPGEAVPNGYFLSYEGY